MSVEPVISIWTVYRPTTVDYPGKWVARRTRIYPGGVEATDAQPTAVADTLEGCRDKLPFGLHRMDRWAGDDAVIEEVWL